MNELVSVSDLSELAQAINREHRLASQAINMALHHAMKAGRLLIEAKVKIEHGGWLLWLKENCDFSDRTAQVYMRLARELADPAKAQRVADLPLRVAIKEIAQVRPPLVAWEGLTSKDLEALLDDLWDIVRHTPHPEDFYNALDNLEVLRPLYGLQVRLELEAITDDGEMILFKDHLFKRAQEANERLLDMMALVGKCLYEMTGVEVPMQEMLAHESPIEEGAQAGAGEGQGPACAPGGGPGPGL